MGGSIKNFTFFFFFLPDKNHSNTLWIHFSLPLCLAINTASQCSKPVQLVRQHYAGQCDRRGGRAKQTSGMNKLATDEMVQGVHADMLAGWQYMQVLVSYSSPLSRPACRLGKLAIQVLAFDQECWQNWGKWREQRKEHIVFLRYGLIPFKLLFVSTYYKSQEQLRCICTNSFLFKI